MKIPSILVFCLLITCGCTKNYKPLQRLSGHAKSFLPFEPGDTITFVNLDGKEVNYISPINKNTYFYLHATDGTCEECGVGSPEIQEIYRAHCYEFDKYTIQFTEEISIKSAQVTGDEYEVLTLTLKINNREYQNELIADDYENWIDGIVSSWWGSYPHFSDEYPYINYNFNDTLLIGSDTFYHVFTDGKKNFFYSQDKGIIGYKTDTTIWINKLYK